MKVIAVSICVALCLGLTMGQVQLRVYRGTLVHSRVLEQIEVLEDHLLGFDENNLGEVSTCIYSKKFFHVYLLCVCCLSHDQLWSCKTLHTKLQVGSSYSYLYGSIF